MTFEDLDLIEPIRKALVQEGYTTPTPIQSEAIPIVSQGYDLLGCAQTGTGKTAAFSIPIIQRLYLQKKKGYKRGIKALILTPTRELAIQIGESFAAYGRFAGLRHTVIFGGVGQKPQTEALERGIDILIATPGRLLDLIGQGFSPFHSIGTVVPRWWHSRATTMARACHKDGTAMPPICHPVRHLSIQTVRFSELFGAITLYFLLK